MPRDLWAGHDAEAIFDEIRYSDYLLHNPFESFASVESFLGAAVKDPHVVAIKMTLYRIGQDSPLVDMLIEAAEAGKQVAVLVELKARFDERNNIIWANRLEQAGIHVVYGLVNLKTHCKLCLVVRQEPDGIRRYAHIGTGNYNAATSKVYTDLGYFTSEAAILDDVSEVFNYLTGYSNKRAYTDLLVAPVSLRSGMRALIEREVEHAKAGRPARLIFKNNAITDPGMIRCLYAASQAGVTIDLMTRGVCCLRPGVPGVSETISGAVHRGPLPRALADLLLRERRQPGGLHRQRGPDGTQPRPHGSKCCARFAIPDLRHHLRHVVLDAVLRDTDRASALQPDGEYVRVRPEEGQAPVNSQIVLLEHYAQDDL